MALGRGLPLDSHWREVADQDGRTLEGCHLAIVKKRHDVFFCFLNVPAVRSTEKSPMLFKGNGVRDGCRFHIIWILRLIFEVRFPAKWFGNLHRFQ